jgi:O-antigen/teichoic acid export membrane protein
VEQGEIIKFVAHQPYNTDRIEYVLQLTFTINLRMSSLTVVKNAFASLCRGGSAALVTLLLPTFLTRVLSKDAYSTWLLILQLSTCVSFLDFGIQTAVGRYVAHCNELGDHKKRDSIVSTSLMILTISGLLAIAGIVLLAWRLPNLFRDMPHELHQDAQLALLFVGSSLAIALPFTVFGGIFIGLQRYDVPAWIIGSSRIIGAIFVVLVAQSSKSIVLMAVVFSMFNIATYLWLFLAYKLLSTPINISFRLVNKESFTEISDYCLSLFVWSIGMLLVNGLDTTIVGYFDYKSVSYYAVPSSIVIFIAGVQSSAFSALMPVAAASTNKDPKVLGKLLISSTKLSVLTSMIFGLVLFVFGQEILTKWIGAEYAVNSILILQLLIIANVIRSSLIPYSVLLIGTGEQRLVKKSPLIEGGVNLLFSISAAYMIGAYGVALGTIVGSVALWLMCIFDNMPRTNKIYFDRKRFINEALLYPIVSIIIPSGVVYIVYNTFSVSSSLVVMSIGSIFSLILFMISIFSIGMSKTDRLQTLLFVRKIVGY